MLQPGFYWLYSLSLKQWRRCAKMYEDKVTEQNNYFPKPDNLLEVFLKSCSYQLRMVSCSCKHDMVAASFTPWWVCPCQIRPHISSTSDQVFKIYLSLTKKKDNIGHTVKQNHTKHLYFLLFYPLKVTGRLKIESLGWVCGGKLAMGWNRYHTMTQSKQLTMRSKYTVHLPSIQVW